MHHRLFAASLLTVALAAPQSLSAASLVNDTEYFSVLSVSLPDLDEPAEIETPDVEPGQSATVDLPEGESRIKINMSQQVHFVFAKAGYEAATELRIAFTDDGPVLHATAEDESHDIPGVLINTRGGASEDDAPFGYQALVAPADVEDAAAALGSSPDELAEGWRGRVAFGDVKGTGRLRAADDGLSLRIRGRIGKKTLTGLVDAAMRDGWLWYVTTQTPGDRGRVVVYDRQDDDEANRSDILKELRDKARGQSGKALIASVYKLSAGGQDPGADPDEDVLCAVVSLDFDEGRWTVSFVPISRAQAMLDEAT